MVPSSPLNCLICPFHAPDPAHVHVRGHHRDATPIGRFPLVTAQSDDARVHRIPTLALLPDVDMLRQLVLIVVVLAIVMADLHLDLVVQTLTAAQGEVAVVVQPQEHMEHDVEAVIVALVPEAQLCVEDTNEVHQGGDHLATNAAGEGGPSVHILIVVDVIAPQRAVARRAHDRIHGEAIHHIRAARVGQGLGVLGVAGVDRRVRVGRVGALPLVVVRVGDVVLFILVGSSQAFVYFVYGDTISFTY